MRSPSPTTDKSRSNLDFDTQIAKFTPRQMEGVKKLDSGLIKFLLYGGALGGGKSYFLRWYAVRRLFILYKHYGLTNVPVMLACEDYPTLKDRQLSKIGREFPSWLGKIHTDHKEYGKAFVLNPRWGGGIICFRNLDDPSKYQSSEFALIEVDELTKNLYEVFTDLRMRLRWPGLPDVECQFVGGTNPGGIGHAWVKQLWMDQDFPEEWTKPIDYRSMFSYIPSKADDNPHLDASYWAMLNTLPPSIRDAFRDGSWDVYTGQAFPEFSRQKHVIDPIPIPEGAPLYMTFDWGFGKPFSIGWWWTDGDGRLYRCGEWYGWSGSPDEGLRITDPQIAEGIIEREKALFGSRAKYIHRLAGPDCFSKKPNYKGGGQGPATSEEFGKLGVYLSKGDPTREQKIKQFHERLRVLDDAPPMMLVYSTCKQFIRTIPALIVDKNRPEDIDTEGEDHVFDEACHVCMARPLALDKPKPKKSAHDKRIEELERGKMDNWESTALFQQRLEMNRLQGRSGDFGDMAEYEDGSRRELIPTQRG